MRSCLSFITAKPRGRLYRCLVILAKNGPGCGWNSLSAPPVAIGPSMFSMAAPSARICIKWGLSAGAKQRPLYVCFLSWPTTRTGHQPHFDGSAPGMWRRGRNRRGHLFCHRTMRLSTSGPRQFKRNRMKFSAGCTLPGCQIKASGTPVRSRLVAPCTCSRVADCPHGILPPGN